MSLEAAAAAAAVVADAAVSLLSPSSAAPSDDRSSLVSSALRSARASRPPPPAPPGTPERAGVRKRSLEMLRTAGDSTLCDGRTEEGDEETAMAMVVTSSASLEQTDGDLTTSSALSLTTSEHDQGAGDFSSPPRPACPPAWMARLTWAPRIPKMPYSSLRARFGSSDDNDHACPVPMKSRKIDRTPIHLEL